MFSLCLGMCVCLCVFIVFRCVCVFASLYAITVGKWGRKVNSKSALQWEGFQLGEGGEILGLIVQATAMVISKLSFHSFARQDRDSNR